MRLEYGILGPFVVEVDGHPVRLGGEKERSVLAMLVLNANEVVSRDRLIDLLWGERPPPTAKNTLQTYVSRLRKALHAAGPEVLVTRAPGYVLVVEDGAIDAQRFERLVAAGQRSLACGEPDAAAGELATALGLWRGPPLGDFTYGEFAAPHIARLEEMRLAATETKLTADVESGRHREAVPRLESLVREHPYREGLWETLMLALYRDGRQSDALRAYQTARRLLAEELGLEPSFQLQELEQRILAHDPSLVPAGAPAARPTGNLPAELSGFVGRASDLEELYRMSSASRLITLLGVGGVGKSRLALELARRLAPGFADGAWFVELSGVEDPAYVESTVGSVWADTGPGAPGFDVVGHLESKDLLLVLDTCERAIAGVAPLVERILQGSPGVRVLATSREPLGCRGEVLWRVQPLDLPVDGGNAGVGDLGSYDSVALFELRASEVSPGFELDSDAAGVVAEIVEVLDGLPLAIELAAARVGDTTLPELLLQLDTHQELFVTRVRTAPLRQRALAQTIDWSYEQLARDEQELFGRLGTLVFEFPLEAAEIVCGGMGIDERDVARLLQRLVDKSLVAADLLAGGTRYRLLDTIRTYAYDKVAKGHVPQHARGFMVNLAQRTDPRLRGGVEEMWRWLLSGDAELVRDALERSADAFAEQEGAFLAGGAAALMSRTGRVAFLGGIDPAGTGDADDESTYHVRSVMRRFLGGFRAGVRHVDEGVEVVEAFLTSKADFTEAFRNSSGASKAAATLYGRDVDVIFHAAGTVGPLVFEHARRFSADTPIHRWGIGVDADEYHAVGRDLKPYVLASVTKQVPSIAYRSMKERLMSGQSIEGPVFDLANHGVGLATSGGHLDPHAGLLADLEEAIVAHRMEPEPI